MGEVDFLQELKRRKVVRAALVYGAVAFAVLQAADLIFPMLGLPAWTVTLVLGLLAAGFPVLLVVAWVFEVQDGQVRRTPESPAQGTHVRWLGARAIVVAVLLIGAGVAAGWLLRPRVDAGGSNDASLAVLPFENVGGVAGNEAFAVGLHDDLLTQLSRIGGLRLVSRTSVKEYANTNRNLRDIAQELGVATVLEGSVQRDAQHIRINVQLIEGETDRHLWAETYDKDLTVANIFAIQAEIAAAIAAALRTELGGAERAEIARAPTENMRAYDAYLRGLAGGFWSYDSVTAKSFEEARRIDSEFAEAWAGEARSKTWLARIANSGGDGIRGAQMSAEARVARDAAARLAPDAIETKLARGYYAYYIDWDLPQALKWFREIERAQPNRVDVLIAIGQVLRRTGGFDDAYAHFKRAALLDQRDADPHQEIGTTGVALHRFEEALRSAELCEALQPGWDDNQGSFVPAYVGLGDTIGARAFLVRTRPRLVDAGSMTPDSWLLLDASPELARERLERARADRSNVPPSQRWWAVAAWAYRANRADIQRLYADSLRTGVDAALAKLPAGTDPRVRANHHRLLALAHAYLGDHDSAGHHAETAMQLLPCSLDSMECLIPLDNYIEVLVVTGRHQDAIAHLRQIAAAPSWWSPARMRIDPLTKPLRGYPEFQRLLSS